MTPAPLLPLIERFEGCQLKSYLCPAHVWTCGWGATGPDIGPDTMWTQAYADARLELDADIYATAVLRLSPILAGNAARHAAIASFAYNVGLTAYKASTLKKRVDAGDWTGAAREIQRWVHGGGRRLPGLVLRRASEARLLLEGHAS